MNRRTLLTMTGAAVALAGARMPAMAANASFEQPKLPYAQDALAPTISLRTVALHYGKHHKGYFDTLNEITAGTPYAGLSLEEVITRSKTETSPKIANNAGQAWNHIHYWNQFAGGSAPAEGRFLEAVNRDFGSVDALKEKMVSRAGDVFGTGWVWLVEDRGKLDILALQDAGNPIAEGKVPLAGIDVWEHAYYLDYENRRAAHVKAVLDNLVNWGFVGRQMSA